tara:strand:+ start:385 stop:615 length:231 start_codon:yes stop_codon:yes gene_type:complete
LDGKTALYGKEIVMKFISRNFEVIITPLILVVLWLFMFAFFNMNAKLEAVYTCEPVRLEEPLFPVMEIEKPEWCER